MSETEKPFNKYRPLAIILETLPIVIALIGFISANSSLVVIGCTVASLFYMVLSWYLFKGFKFTPADVIASLILGLGLSVSLNGMLFYFMKWDHNGLMLSSTSTIFFFCFVLALIYMVVKSMDRENFKYEIRMSLKIISRYVILLVIFLSTGMYKVLGPLF